MHKYIKTCLCVAPIIVIGLFGTGKLQAVNAQSDSSRSTVDFNTNESRFSDENSMKDRDSFVTPRRSEESIEHSRNFTAPGKVHNESQENVPQAKEQPRSFSDINESSGQQNLRESSSSQTFDNTKLAAVQNVDSQNILRPSKEDRSFSDDNSLNKMNQDPSVNSKASEESKSSTLSIEKSKSFSKSANTETESDVNVPQTDQSKSLNKDINESSEQRNLTEPSTSQSIDNSKLADSQDIVSPSTTDKSFSDTNADTKVNEKYPSTSSDTQTKNLTNPSVKSIDKSNVPSNASSTPEEQKSLTNDVNNQTLNPNATDKNVPSTIEGQKSLTNDVNNPTQNATEPGSSQSFDTKSKIFDTQKRTDSSTEREFLKSDIDKNLTNESDQGVVTIKKDIVEFIQTNPTVTVFLDKLNTVDFSCVFPKDGGVATVFIPSNEAFDKLPADVKDDLMKPENRDKLCKILAFHVVPQKVVVTDGTKEFTTSNGKKITVRKEGEEIFVNDAKVIQKAFVKPNGSTIFVIDKVLLP